MTTDEKTFVERIDRKFEKSIWVNRLFLQVRLNLTLWGKVR